MNNNAQGHTYEIVVRGHLDTRFATWFEGLKLTTRSDGNTSLQGIVLDQAALHSHLSRIGDLGLVLMSLRIVDDGK